MKQLKDFLTEGGNAVPNVSRINQENVEATLIDLWKEFLPKLKLKKTDIALLGSTGKKRPGDTSGDIDAALSSKALLSTNGVDTFADIMDFIVRAIKSGGYNYKDMRSMGIISFAFPITNTDGKQPNQFVQVDFMVVQNIKFASWAFFSPNYIESEFKGVYRNLLNFAVAKHAKLDVRKVDPMTKTPTEWSRYWLTQNDGLSYGVQTNISDKTGKITKTQRTLEKKHITYDPDEIVAFLYGSKYKAKDLMTFENTLKAVLSNDFPNKAARKIILKQTAETFEREGMPVPESMAKHL